MPAIGPQFANLLLYFSSQIGQILHLATLNQSIPNTLTASVSANHSSCPRSNRHSLIRTTVSWDAWAQGAADKTDDSDRAWQSAAAPKTYMMPVSPWFYTDLPQYNKNWVWRGDDMWHNRWQQVLQVQPQFVEVSNSESRCSIVICLN